MNCTIEATKGLFKDYVCLFKVGTFYVAYDRDAYIMSYVFKYKLQDKKDSKECGFPIDSVNKIKARLEQEKINYALIDTRCEYSITEKSDIKNLNRYDEVYAKARNYVNYKLRVESINKILLDSINEKNFRKTLAKVEEIVYESGEV